MIENPQRIHISSSIMKSKTSLVHKVELVFFQDSATGDWGLTHRKTYKEKGGQDGFNAFYSGDGIFHDVFEHWHEYAHKYFQNEFAMNVGGEMAAMGAMWYYVDKLGFYERLGDTVFVTHGDRMRNTTESLCAQAIGEGYCNFGYLLKCAVPRQSDSENEELEFQIDRLYSNVVGYKRRVYPSDLDIISQDIKDEREDVKRYGEAYRKSVTRSNVANLHRWGFKMAEKLVPNTNENRHQLSEFISFFNKFCKQIKAEELANYATGITIEVYHNEDKNISWKAWLDLKPGATKEKILIDNTIMSLDEVTTLFKE